MARVDRFPCDKIKTDKVLFYHSSCYLFLYLPPEAHTMLQIHASMYWGWDKMGCHFADDIFKCIFLNENAWIPIEISPKFDPKGPVNNITALVQIMAWCWLDDNPFHEPMMVRLWMHVCITQPQWVKDCGVFVAIIVHKNNTTHLC